MYYNHQLHARGVRPREPPKTIKFRDYSKLDIERVADILTDDDWSGIVGFDDVDTCFECFSLVVSGIMDVLLPIKCKRVKRHVPPWSLTPQARYARFLRNKAHKLALKVNTSESCADYKRLRNLATSKLRKCKSTYYTNLAKDMSTNPKKFWRSVSHISKSNLQSSNFPHSAHEYNQFFLNIPSEIDASMSQSYIFLQPLILTIRILYLSVLSLSRWIMSCLI